MTYALRHWERAFGALALAGLACRSEPEAVPHDVSKPALSSMHSAPGTPLPVASAPAVAPRSSSQAGAVAELSASAPQPRTRLDGPDDGPAASPRILLEALNEIGPAAPVSAFDDGVVMLTRNDELVIARFDGPSSGKSREKSLIAPLPLDARVFSRVGRPPALGEHHAYFIARGKLMRRALSGGELEVLAPDARDGTRVALAGSPEAVAYVTEHGGLEAGARLRLADGSLFDLVTEGAAAHSVGLAAVGEDLLVAYLDARTSMSPLHVRKLNVKARTLGPDVVVWVAGATQSESEIAFAGLRGEAWLLLPVERDATHFGLATLLVGREPSRDAPLRFRTFANGIDRAPALSRELCGLPMALYVRPIDAHPGSSQELAASPLTLAERASSEVLAQARAFYDVSLSPNAGGGVLAYVADGRTWVRKLRCRAP